MASSDSYTLRQVVELTGLSEFTLRGWENRYKAFSPARSSTGRRRYSAQDLKKALLLRELTQMNHRIGDIAHLTLKKLNELLEGAGATTVSGQENERAPVSALFKRVALQQWDELEKDLRSTTARCDSAFEALRKIIIPLLKELGFRVSQGHVSVSQEHILSALLKERLHVLHDSRPRSRGRARIVIAAPEGDLHELGILTAHVMVGARGIRSLYLGPNSPKSELCETVHRYGATHVLLGATVSRQEGAREDLFSYIHFLDRHLGPNVSLWLGGRHGAGIQVKLQRELRTFLNLQDLDEALSQLV